MSSNGVVAGAPPLQRYELPRESNESVTERGDVAEVRQHPFNPGRAPAELHGPLPSAFGRGPMMSVVAHELRSSLAAIKSSVEVLAENFDHLEPDRARAMVEATHRRTVWLHGLVENMLCFALVGEERFKLQTRPLSPLDLVQEACAIVEPILAERRQKLVLNAPVELPRVHADSVRLVQVLINLLLNASKYSGVGTTISVQLSKSDTAVGVAVLDRGVGFSQEDAARLFEAFYRSPVSGSSGKDGAGLGLAIVKAVIEAHGGWVRAAPRHGGGARFWFELPISESTQLQGQLAATGVI